MPTDDENFDLDSSPGQADEIKQAAPETAAPAAAESSPAPGEKRTVLSIVRDVAKAAPEASPAPAAETESDDPASQPNSTPANADDDEPDTSLPYYKDPRFQKVLRQRQRFKDRAAALEPDAQQYRNVQSFMDQNGIAPQEAAEALQIAALIKRDPIAAWERLKPTIDQLLRVTGHIMPDDIRTRVARGEISESVARELAQARASAHVRQQQQDVERQLAERRSTTTQATQVHQAAKDWAAERDQRDPNFAAKVPDLEREVLYLQRQEGLPTTAEGVRQQLTKAYRAVNARMAARVNAGTPAPRQAVQPVQGGGVASNSAPPPAKPKSVLDIVRAARGA
jgi:hypothetical protein